MKLKNIMCFFMFLAGAVAVAAGVILLIDRLYQKQPLKKDYIQCESSGDE